MQSALAYMKQYGTSYYYATLFFPASIKRDVIQLYKFVRIPDLIVDNKDIHPLAARMQLESMRNEREDAYRKNDIDDVIW